MKRRKFTTSDTSNGYGDAETDEQSVVVSAIDEHAPRLILAAARRAVDAGNAPAVRKEAALLNLRETIKASGIAQWQTESERERAQMLALAAGHRPAGRLCGCARRLTAIARMKGRPHQ